MVEGPERDQAFILDMLTAAQDAYGFSKGLDYASFLESRLHQNAMIRSLEVMGEAAGGISAGTRAAHPNIPWREIIGMRHRLIHGYADVRLETVWIVVTEQLSPLIPVLVSLIPNEDETKT